MKKILFLVTAAITLITCKLPDIPQPIGGTVDFTYTEVAPFYITFYNKSSEGLSADFWDFGDDKYASGKETITHKYTKAGTYQVELICEDKYGYNYTKTKNITVTGQEQKEYTKAYIKGFKILAIPNSGYYYSLEVHDGLWEGIGNTETVQIKTANLPKTIDLKTRVDVNDAYCVSMWKSASKSGMPYPIFDNESVHKLSELKSKDYPAEVLLYSKDGTSVNAIYEYEE